MIFIILVIQQILSSVRDTYTHNMFAMNIFLHIILGKSDNLFINDNIPKIRNSNP